MNNHHVYHADGSLPEGAQTFVFGSNLSGQHLGGAALVAALHYAAESGVHEGPTGRAYAIPTVAARLAGPLCIEDIAAAVTRFLAYATARQHEEFFITRIGCGIAGHKDEVIAPMFFNAPPNCSLPQPWRRYLE